MVKCVCVGGPKDGMEHTFESEAADRLLFPKFGPNGLEAVYYYRRGNRLYYEGLKFLGDDEHNKEDGPHD